MVAGILLFPGAGSGREQPGLVAVERASPVPVDRVDFGYRRAGRRAPARAPVLVSEVVEAAGAPGMVIDERLTIACGEGALRALRLQRAGRGSLDAAPFLRGYPLPAGVALG